MENITDHKSLVGKVFREAMKRNGITKQLLENDQVRHKFSVSYRKDRNSICLGGDFSCPEMWTAVGKPDFAWYPISQYIPGNLIRGESWIIDFDSGIDEKRIEAYFEELVRDAVKPIVTNMQTPAESVAFFKLHPPILSFGPALMDKYLDIWTEYFNLEESKAL
jgi:hypothetical protein